MRAPVLVALLLWACAASLWADQFDPLPVEHLPVRDLVEPTPVPADTHADDDFEIEGGAGVVAALSGAASSGERTAEISLAFDLADAAKSPRLALLTRFGALQGTAVDLADPTTFRSLGVEGYLSQPLAQALRVKPSLLVGLEFRFDGDLTPRHRAARFAYVGARVDGDAGYLFLGAGGDERLSTRARDTPQYLPAATIVGRLKLGKLTGVVNAYMTARVLLYVRTGYGAQGAGSDVAQIGVLLGGGR